ncbi:Hypothetical predicted protein [Mytilus galloprovincialis]|uniref:Uncharacterized protein n=1 Tax=Mytilus galloprovincialis TaxID=29158 RepID=A0A8B6DDV6_MYTGA|nr:Hypothetical predicted protein [Mytilus galloprovincialis]
MSGKGVKRTNTSDTSVLNDSGSKKPSRKKSKKKNKSKSTEDNSCANTGDSSGDITNIQNFVYTLQPWPERWVHAQKPALVLQSDLGMYPPPIHHMQHISPPTQSASTQQRPTWVDEIFRRMDQFENKLDKLEKIDSFVTSLNAKVIRLEKGTKSLDDRLDQVEKSTQFNE